MSERYPCLYGLRDHCEAVEFAFRILTGEIEKAIDMIIDVKSGEPKTDEEKVVKRIYEAMARYMPKLIAQPSVGGVEVELTRIISGFCELCPHRLNKLHEYRPPSPVRLEYRGVSG